MTSSVEAALSPQRTSFVVPLVIAVGFFMEGLDSTALNTALPAVAAEFHTRPVALSGALTAYMLSLAVFIPASAWVAERFGARRVFAGAILLFVLGSILCAAAQSVLMLILMRAVQGIGGALLTPVGRLILTRSFPKAQLMRAMTYTIVPALIGPMLGPTVGGSIVSVASWRWIFLINVPVGLIGLLLSVRRLPYVAPIPTRRFDGLGFVLMAGGLVSTQIATDSLTQPDAALILSVLGPAAVVLLGVYAVHARKAASPLLDIGLFRLRAFRVGVATGIPARIAMFGPTFLLPLLFQTGIGMSPFMSGTLTSLTAIGALTARFGVTSLMQAVGLREILIANALIRAALLGLVALVDGATPLWLLVPLLVAMGISSTTQFAALNALSLDVPDASLPDANTINAVSQRIAQSLSVAVAAALLALAEREVPGAGLHRFALPFLGLAGISAACILSYRGLSASDGAQISGYRLAPAHTIEP